MNRLALRLKDIGDDKVKALLKRGSSNRVSGLVSGTVATVILDSSSVTIILLITLIDARLIDFAAALPVILGSNIGTTISSQIFAWSLDAYSPIILLIGLAAALLGRSEKERGWGEVIFCLGLILFALGFIGDAVEPLRDQPEIVEQLRRLEAPLLGVLAGAVLTVILQSSSAMLGVIIVMASQGLLTLEAGLAMMLGAEIAPSPTP